MQTGKIKRVMKDRGFGFITSEDGKEVFFHRSECHEIDFVALAEGQQVGFDLEDDPKGPRARNLKAAAAS